MAPLTYPAYVERLERELADEGAMAAAIGRHFDAVGEILRAFLVQTGLAPSHYLIDVGCGAGRLAKHLADYLTGPDLGTDVVASLVEHARAVAQRPDRRSETVRELTIPETDGCADFVCFFSVLTYLSHEDSHRYLAEAARASCSRSSNSPSNATGASSKRRSIARAPRRRPRSCSSRATRSRRGRRTCR